MKKDKIGDIFLVTNEDGESYLDGKFNWYVDLTNDEKIKIYESLLAIQSVLFDSVDRLDLSKLEDEDKGE